VIAALYVAIDGVYSGRSDVDCWDITRNALNYAGPHPVVAHPPCQRWCRLAGLVEKRWGYKRGDDGGTFAHALWAVRTFGGILEHPAYSKAWSHFDLPVPGRHGGWHRGLCGGFSAHVEQCRYGHPAKKATWLYAFGTDLPTLKWGSDLDAKRDALVSWCGNKVARTPDRKRLTSAEASSTPPQFAEALIAIAKSRKKVGHA
jgi:hypothetical protein